MNILNLFRKQLTDIDLLVELGTQINIRNGVGYGFISDKFLYDNQYLEVGIGRVYSGYGDWGGGLDYAADSAIKIIIDRNYNIIEVKTSSFYNSPQSKKTELRAKKLAKNLRKIFVVKLGLFRHCIDSLFDILPCKHHIDLDVDFKYPNQVHNMLDYFVNLKSEYCIPHSKSANA